ncbi:hypothetical protein [Methanosarcina sp.]|uniref:hypothetical protein n=1 Tax=Methanosarcina sp. TaxID=2213 RepID=UPI003BB6DFE3
MAEENTNKNLNDTINGNNTQTFSWVILLPPFLGFLLFLCWMCRFFDRMNFCFVVFILILLILLLLPLNSISTIIRYFFVIVLLFILGTIIYYEVFSKRKKENESNPIMNLHDIVRNYIVISAILIWPLILFYFNQNDIDNVTFNGIDNLKFPIYIITASTIGALSYLLLSIEETFGHLISEYKKISITWSYIRRILIAPFIALIGVYTLKIGVNILTFQNKDVDPFSDVIFFFIFSFFAGFFTKPVEEWVYAGVQKTLPNIKKEEFNARTQYEVKESDFVKKLGLDEDLAYMLYNAKIRTIEELANCNIKELINKVNLDTRNLGEGMGCSVKKQIERLGSYSEQQLQKYIDKAQEYMGIDKSELVTELKMDRELTLKLYKFANIRTIEDLSTRNEKYIHSRLIVCKEEVDESTIKEHIDAAIEYMNIDKSELVTKLNMRKDLAFKLSHFAGIKYIQALSTSEIEDVYNNLGVCKEDVSKETIKEYIEAAKKI